MKTRPQAYRLPTGQSRRSFLGGLAAGPIAERWGLDRQRLDDWALQSHQRAATAADGGLFDDEIVAVTTVVAFAAIRMISLLDRFRILPLMLSKASQGSLSITV